MEIKRDIYLKRFINKKLNELILDERHNTNSVVVKFATTVSDNKTYMVELCIPDLVLLLLRKEKWIM